MLQTLGDGRAGHVPHRDASEGQQGPSVLEHPMLAVSSSGGLLLFADRAECIGLLLLAGGCWSLAVHSMAGCQGC